MPFGSNVSPKKVKKPAGKPWVCGCDIQQPHYLVRCPRCGLGQVRDKGQRA